MKLVNTNRLRVQQVGKNEYITWATPSRILFFPKASYKLEDNGEIISCKIINYTKSIILNTLVFVVLCIITLYIKNESFNKLYSFTPLFIGYMPFLVLLNYIIIRATKREVNKQLSKTHTKV